MIEHISLENRQCRVLLERENVSDVIWSDCLDEAELIV